MQFIAPKVWSWTTNPQWLICISGVTFRIDTNGGNHVFVQVKVDNSLLKGDVRALFTTNVKHGWSTKSQFGFTWSSCLFYSQIFCSDVMKASFYPIHALFLFIWRQALPVSHDPGIVYYIWQPPASMLLLSRRKEKPCVYIQETVAAGTNVPKWRAGQIFTNSIRHWGQEHREQVFCQHSVPVFPLHFQANGSGIRYDCGLKHR